MVGIESAIKVGGRKVGERNEGGVGGGKRELEVNPRVRPIKW